MKQRQSESLANIKYLSSFEDCRIALRYLLSHSLVTRNYRCLADFQLLLIRVNVSRVLRQFYVYVISAVGQTNFKSCSN